MKARYPETPGFYPVDTSEAAAGSVASEAETLRAACLKALRERGPMTSDEVAAAVGESVLSVRPRLTELKKQGRAEDTGERRPNASGRQAAVFRAANPPPLPPTRYEQTELLYGRES